MHPPIVLQHVGVRFADHICFENFSASLYPGDRIGLIGPNGSGKTSLLKLLADELPDAAHIDGRIHPTPEKHAIRAIRMHQFPLDPTKIDRSGGELFQQDFAQTLRADPELLLLDEPTNHLDQRNRRRLIRQLNAYTGTLIVATHDTQFLRECTTTLWAFETNAGSAGHCVRIYPGGYDAYVEERTAIARALAAEKVELKTRERSMKEHQQQEQRRAASSRRTNRNENDKNLVRAMQDRGSRTQGKHGKRSAARFTRLTEDQANHRERAAKSRTARFRFRPIEAVRPGRAILTVRDGTCGYPPATAVFATVSFTLHAGDRLAVTGNNGSGKSSLLRTLAWHPRIWRRGEWHLPDPGHTANQIAWIDQFFGQFETNGTVLEELQKTASDWSHAALRRHLNDALFSTNAEVHRPITDLSGGERARLSFACLAARPPRLLLLDEINNHLDRETRTAVVVALQEYVTIGGALVIVSHDADFLEAVGVTDRLELDARRRRENDAG